MTASKPVGLASARELLQRRLARLIEREFKNVHEDQGRPDAGRLTSHEGPVGDKSPADSDGAAVPKLFWMVEPWLPADGRTGRTELRENSAECSRQAAQPSGRISLRRGQPLRLP